MSNYEEMEDALQLIENLRIGQQVTELLRKHKGKEHVRITAENNDRRIHHNLRTAVEENVIGLNEVFDLIRHAEENGNQHLFFYKLKNKSAATSLKYETVASRLWGTSWKTTTSEFPSVRLKTNDYKHSDFRAVPKKPNDWILKIYGHNLITRATGNTEIRGGRLWREYEDVPLRVVLVARWNSPEILELRVQRNESRKSVERWHNKIWEMLNPALLPTQFEGWALEKSIARLVLEQEKNKALYYFRDAKVIDPAGIHATFETHEEQGDLFASEQTRTSLQSYVKESECKGLTVTWLPGLNNTPEKETRTLLAARQPHEIIVQAHCSGQDLDYVTNQLRRFSK